MAAAPARTTSSTRWIGTAFLGLAAVLGALALGWESWRTGRGPDIGALHVLACGPAFATAAVGVALRGRWLRRLGVDSPRGLVALGGLTSMTSVVALLAVAEPGRSFTHDRTTGVRKAYARVRSLGLANVGICRCSPDAKEKIVLPGGFSTLLSLYDNGAPGPRPGVVVAHGNTWLGGGLSTYRVIARHLADKGFVVATVDFPGFGKSDDPFERGPAAVADAYNRPAVLRAAVDWLVGNTEADPARVTLFGHSGGVDWALRLAPEHPSVANVAVMVAPPPPVVVTDPELGSSEYDDARSAYFSKRFAEQHEFVYRKPVPEWYRWELAQPNGRFSDDVFTEYESPGHKPLLVFLGEHDQPGGHDAVRSRFDALAEPKQLIVLPRSDHYLNTAQTLGFVVYDEPVVRRLTEELIGWVE